jgi:predicted kinase
MSNTVLILIAGPPGTGKTTLAERISEKFRLPLIYKDSIKETLFDSLGTGDREWSRKLGISSYRLLFYLLESLLKVGNSTIVESNFRPDDSKKFIELQEKYAFKSLQVFCTTSADIILQRYRKRSESGGRHPGHLDDVVYRELEEELLRGGYRPLDINGDLVLFDTTDFDKTDYGNLYVKIQRFVDA